MIVLHTLGESVIEVGAERVGPGAPHVFGLLLYLCIERGRRESRSVLQLLFFPESPERKANHSLRQLIYKTRQLGVPLDTELGGVWIDPAIVRDDYSALLAGLDDAELNPAALAGGFLPGYNPAFSHPFGEWLEQQRTRVHTQLRRSLVTVLERHRVAGEWREAERVARACLALDPLNEPATLALAEMLALNGSRVEAVRLLDGYLQEVETEDRELARPALLLRRRISERLPRRVHVPTEPTFRGRGAEMTHLQEQLAVVRGGSARACLVWGEAGIGKTRLVTEFGRAAVLAGATVQSVSFQPHDIRRPMAAFSDLVPSLRRLPGALGCSPEALGFLDRLVRMDADPHAALSAEVRDAEYLSARITRGLSELLDAVAAESTLVLILEDVHWLDRLSLHVFDDLLSERKPRRLLLLLTSREMTAPPAAERATVLRVAPLAEEDSVEVFTEQLARQELTVEEDYLRWCLQIAAGNPFFIRELSRHYAATRETYQVPTTLTDLLARRLSLIDAIPLKALQACAVLGKHATFDRVERMLALPRVGLLEAVQRLEEHGLLTSDGEQLVPGHALLADVVMKRATTTVRKYLHRHAAEVLAPEILADLGLGWACAEHWERAGVPGRSVEVLRRCAQHAVAIGRPGEAVSSLEHALSLTPGLEQQFPILEELIEAAQTQQNWPLVIRTIDRYRHTQEALRRPIDPFDDYELGRVLASMWAEQDLGVFTSTIHRFLTHDFASDRQRVNAANLWLILTLNLMDADSARLGRDVAVRFLGTPLEPDALKALIMYHTHFGDPQEAIQLSFRLVEHAFTASDLGPRSRCSYTNVAAQGLWRNGMLQEALPVLEKACEVAQAAGLGTSQIVALASRTEIMLLTGDLTAARQCYYKTEEIAAQHERLGAAVAQHLSNGIYLSLLEGKTTEARRLLQHTREVCGRVEAGRDQMLWRSYRMRVEQIEGRGPYSPAELDDLLKLHERTRTHYGQDEVVEALWHAFNISGRSKDADRILKEYITMHRRERTPLSPGLNAVMRQ